MYAPLMPSPRFIFPHASAVSGVSMATGELNDRGSEGEEVTRHVLNPGNKVSAAARGSLRRLRSLFGCVWRFLGSGFPVRRGVSGLLRAVFWSVNKIK